MKLNLGKIRKLGSLRQLKGLSKRSWIQQKRKAAVFTKLFTENPLGRQIVHRDMKQKWYRHIDKALEGKSVFSDERHWKRMLKTFKKQMVGVPSEETTALIHWLEGFIGRVKREAIVEEDKTYWLPEFRAYMEDCEHSAADLYIMKNKLVE